MQMKSAKKAFTLIELLIVIAVIGILFVVLISKVDFATDKSKATGVQTDFRSFQLAFETVARENAGFNTLGWDEGDTNGDRVRNSFDEGDLDQDGICDPESTPGAGDGEVFTGRKVYTETWTGVYTLVNPANASDMTAIAALEAAINKNLDPKLHISIANDLTITMANQAVDPWKTEYVGKYMTNASNDGLDRGAILIYSKGANLELGSKEKIADGVVTVTVSTVDADHYDGNTAGMDDYSVATVYTYKNGYGEVVTTSTGFSNNQ